MAVGLWFRPMVATTAVVVGGVGGVMGTTITTTFWLNSGIESNGGIAVSSPSHSPKCIGAALTLAFTEIGSGSAVATVRFL